MSSSVQEQVNGIKTQFEAAFELLLKAKREYQNLWNTDEYWAAKDTSLLDETELREFLDNQRAWDSSSVMDCTF